ncbi:MAG: protein kinase domain-containing protein [Vicinamibacterales bacterium]
MRRLFSAVADRYRIEREIGSGGMATVYLARDLKHDRDVALKVLRPELAAVLGTSRFLNEIRISARLDHPHILTLIDSGAVPAGHPEPERSEREGPSFLYYVMPFVRGESLRHRLERERQLPLDDALDITRQITSALDYAHRQGIVHRDIKPENILLHEGEAVLADFGIAMAVKEAGGNRVTESGVSLGTPQYMSPEQATGDRAPDARSDIYSMAAVLYEMLAGEPPHSGATVQAVIAKLLTERPTRLSVLRDTVPEGIDTAVAKALAKLPADRFATAGDFARALAATGTTVHAQPSARSRRLVPLMIAGTVAVAAGIGAVFALTRKPAPLPQPDRVQLTLTGNAMIPSLNRDGTRLAFAEKQCNQAGCTYQLVIKDVDDIDGSSHFVLTRNLEWIWHTRWTDDAGFVLFAASYGGSRRGLFAISTLGGEARQLPCCWPNLVGDTAFISAGFVAPGADSVGWVRRVTVHDGQTIDSLRVRDIGDFWTALPLTPNRLLIIAGKTSRSAPELRLTDFGGNVIHRMSPGFGSLGRQLRWDWVPSRQQLILASQRDLGGTEYDVVSLHITRSAIAPRIDTLLSAIGLRDGIFMASKDGERFVYYTGPVETEMSMIDVDRTPTKRLAVNHVSSATTRVSGRFSPAADRILLARDVPRPFGHASRFSIMARSGAAESPIAGMGAVENLLDFGWSPDGARIMYLQGMGGGRIRLMERDTAGGLSPREIVRRDESAAVIFHPLADGAVSIIPPDRRSISIIRRPGKPDTTLRVPEWMGGIGWVARSADAKSLLMAARTASLDSIVVATVDIETGDFTRIATRPGEDVQAVTRVKDGSIMFVYREPGGAFALYRVSPGRPAERLGALPHSRAEFSVSTDGRVAAFGYNDKNDVYMIRNFGKMLRR